MIINVLVTNDQSFVIDVESNETISQIKDRIYKQEGIHPTHFALVYLGQLLKADMAIKDTRITAGVTIQLLPRLKART